LAVAVYRHVYDLGQTLTQAPAKPKSLEEVIAFLVFLVKQFKHHIENQRGWELLWTDSRHRPEKAAQRLFQGMAAGCCNLLDVAMSPESNAGNGPVDFVFSTGYRARILVEIKHISNSKYWNGPGAQLPTYLHDHDVNAGIFVAIGYTADQIQGDRATGLADYVHQVSESSSLTILSEVIDARPTRISASKRKA
jgi:hypothetical protein